MCGGRKPTGLDAQRWAIEAEARGAGEILLTSMDRDGTKSGFDCDLTRTIATSVRIPVIASGGAGEPSHFVDVFQRARRMQHWRHRSSTSDWSLFEAIKEELRRGRSGEAAMLIPSIDLMGGKIVQLVQGEKKALEFDNFEEWAERFSSYPLVQLIDLDAAMG